MRAPLAKRAWSWAMFFTILSDISPSYALQPLAEFVRGAKETNPETHEAIAVEAQREAETAEATWRLLPSFSAQGSYTRNQYEREVAFPGASGPEPFMAINQWDAALVLTVPLIDVAAWETRKTAQAVSEVARANREAVSVELERQVVRAYYQYLGSAALKQSAEKSLELSKNNATVVEDRASEGMATQLDVKRAQADVARAEQDVAAIDLAEVSARRQLFSLSGVQPLGATKFPEDDLKPEAPLDEWLAATDSTPRVQAAHASRKVSESQASISNSAWYPTLTGVAQERFTNATALVGHSAYYSLSLNLAWRFSGANFYKPQAQEAAVNASKAREVQTKKSVQDAVFQAWHQVQSGITRARSARVQAETSKRAVELAKQQYVEGMSTQLELLTAQQDAFRAEVARIQADTDLAYARAALRLLSSHQIGAHAP